MKVLLDTDVLLDVLAKRDPHYENASGIWSLAEQGQVQGCVSAISFNNIYYVIRRLGSNTKARHAMVLLRSVFEVVALDEQVLNQAIDSEIKDFEDAIQFFSAIRAAASSIVTRNTKDYAGDDLPIQTPAEFLASYFAE